MEATISNVHGSRETVHRWMAVLVGFLLQVTSLGFAFVSFFFPHLLFRNSREAWEASGCKHFEMRAKEKAIELLRAYQPKPLPRDVEKALDELVNDGLKGLAK